ncbi:MAG: ribonuclease HII [Parachlamydiaceae bacterium]|nr:ribonuclease HII [Parachlamydiaceae bacterium]
MVTLKRPKSLKVSAKEWKRLLVLNQYENDARAKGFQHIFGLDEAGRGPLAGPVVASACMIPEGVYFPEIDDSKKLTAAQRENLFELITTHPDVLFSIGIISHTDIDRINIYQASIEAMLAALSKLEKVPDCLLVDGMNFPHPAATCVKIIKGDSLSQSIAAASIIAKVTRDRIMIEYHGQWPQYGFDRHKGYSTSFHIDAIKTHGICDIHRLSFAPCQKNDQQLLLFPIE